MISALERLAGCIRTRRKLLGMSQEMLAEKTGLSLSLIRRIERKVANPTLTNLEKIASVLGEDIADLFNSHTMQDTNKLKKHLILTELGLLPVNQLLLIRKLIKSFKKEDEDEYLATTLGKISLNRNLKDNHPITVQKEDEDKYLNATLGKIPLTINLKDNQPISAQLEEEDEYLDTTFGKIPLKRNLKDNPPISTEKS